LVLGFGDGLVWWEVVVVVVEWVERESLEVLLAELEEWEEVLGVVVGLGEGDGDGDLVVNVVVLDVDGVL